MERGGMDWIELAQDRDRLWMFVNLIMNIRTCRYIILLQILTYIATIFC